ncbi:MAG: sigma-70 family RNA polymerase sigma factor [Pyrinomonadaceae bacterium]|nr:sigma-70 family RNA polymerase sigma factor [Phycisphaerales bacterium]
MHADHADQTTQILADDALSADERAAKLLPLVYSQLRAIAQKQMASERKDHTLQATALVNEAYIKLIGNRQVPWQSRAHFCVAAAEAMRQILLDHARSKRRLKRGGGARKLPLNLIELAMDDDPDLIVGISDAMDRLHIDNPEAAQIIQLRVFAGRSLSEISEMLDIPERTLDRRWKSARAWLYREVIGMDAAAQRSDTPDDAS